MRIPAPIRWTPALAFGLWMAASGVLAHDAKHKHPELTMNRQNALTKSADIDLRDRTLLNQEGREVKFVSEVIGERIVVMDFVYTTCTNVCPVLTALLSQVQRKLGERLGDEVVMVTVTVDPIRDTPQRLKAHAAKYGAGEGWTWLTGPKPVVDDVLNGVGAYSANFEDHPPMVLVGDGRTGHWSRFFGFPSPDRIIDRVKALQAARSGAAGG
jgi:protein SCO1/2